MKTIRLVCNLVLVAGLIVACQESPSPVSGTDSGNRPLLTDYTAHILAPGAFSGEGLSKEERESIARNSVDDQFRMSTLIQQAESWGEAHAAMQDLLKTPSPLPDYIREQRAAVFMIRAARTLESVGDNERAGIAGYAEMLARHRSPEAGLLLEALQLLDGYWSPDQIRVAAASGMEGAEKFLENRYYCESCLSGKKDGTAHEAIASSQDAFISEILGSLDKLEALATGA